MVKRPGAVDSHAILTSPIPVDPVSGSLLGGNQQPAQDGGERILTKEKGRFIITEQVYIHSKLMIVDDAVAIIGSANVNDRSLNGNGDSEIAAVIRDNDKQEGVDLGNGVRVTTRTFAKNLRVALWRKHFGLEIGKGDAQYMRADRVGNDNAQSGLSAGRRLDHPPRKAQASVPTGIQMDKPAALATARVIQAQALANAKIYESVFRHTPRNTMKKFGDVAACWPKRFSKSGMAIDAARNGGMVAGVVARSPSTVAVAASVPKAQSVDADFGAEPPALSESFMKANDMGATVEYDKGRIHNIERALQALRELVGFFVLMPLDFGVEEKNSWLGGEKGNFSIASIGTKTGLPTREAYEAKLASAGVHDAGNTGAAVS